MSPRVIVHTLSRCLLNYRHAKKLNTKKSENFLTEIEFSRPEIPITGLQKYKKNRNTKNRNTKNKLQKFRNANYRNTNYRNTEITITEIKKN